MPVAVPLIAAGVGAAGSVLASNANKSAAKATANASQQATDAATAEQRRQYDQSRADQAPWLQTGTSALNQLAGLYGLQQSGQPNAQTQQYGGLGTTNQINQGRGRLAAMGQDAFIGEPSIGTGQQGPATMVAEGSSQPGNLSSFFTSPDYQFRQNESMRALTARNAALGIQDSGAAQRSALQLSGNLASGEFNNYANRLAALAGVGQTAANNSAQYGQNYANNVGNLATQNAANLASSYQQQGAANSNLYSGLAGIGSGLINNIWGAR